MLHLFLDSGLEPRISYLCSVDSNEVAHGGLRIARWPSRQASPRCGIARAGPPGVPIAPCRRFADVLGPRIIASGSPLTRPKGHLVVPTNRGKTEGREGPLLPSLVQCWERP